MGRVQYREVTVSLRQNTWETRVWYEERSDLITAGVFGARLSGRGRIDYQDNQRLCQKWLVKEWFGLGRGGKARLDYEVRVLDSADHATRNMTHLSEKSKKARGGPTRREYPSFLIRLDIGEG